jgi:hypothetical protein
VDFEASLEFQANNTMPDAPIIRHKTLFNLGIVYRRVGDTSRSIDNLKKASI